MMPAIKRAVNKSLPRNLRNLKKIKRKKRAKMVNIKSVSPSIIYFAEGQPPQAGRFPQVSLDSDFAGTEDLA